MSDKGFGFLDREDGLRFFFHHSAVSGAEWDELYVGQLVSFAEESASNSPRGPRAKSVVVGPPSV